MSSVRLKRSRAPSLLSAFSEAEPLSGHPEPRSAVSDSGLSRSPRAPSSPSDVAFNPQLANGRAHHFRNGRPRSRTIASVLSSQNGPLSFQLRRTSSPGTQGADLTRHMGPYRTISNSPIAETIPSRSSDLRPNAELAGRPRLQTGDAAQLSSTPSPSPSPLLSHSRSRDHSSSSLSRDRVASSASNQYGPEVIVQAPLSLVLARQDSFSRHENAPHSNLAVQTAGETTPVDEGLLDDDDDEHHKMEVVEHLDVIDPGISTVSHLANAANTILIPPIFTSARRPVIELPSISLRESQERLLASDTPNLEESVLPNGQPEELLDELDRHVEHVLTKRQKARRALKGLLAFLKTPMGICVAIYGFLVAFWGAAIVLFLLHWINLHNDYSQRLWIEITCQVENGLFTITGVGLIPWRVMDTYRITRIAHSKVLLRRLRRKGGLPRLTDENDIPDTEASILTEQQWKSFQYQQQMFMKSQTWYRPHETETHRAFSITTALWICLLIDGNSIFQCMLCGTMWGLNMYDRPAWTTGCLVPFSFLCGIGAAVLIWRGGEATKKVHHVENKLRRALNLEEEESEPSQIRRYPDQQQHRLSHERPEKQR